MHLLTLLFAKFSLYISSLGDDRAADAQPTFKTTPPTPTDFEARGLESNNSSRTYFPRKNREFSLAWIPVNGSICPSDSVILKKRQLRLEADGQISRQMTSTGKTALSLAAASNSRSVLEMVHPAGALYNDPNKRPESKVLPWQDDKKEENLEDVHENTLIREILQNSDVLERIVVQWKNTLEKRAVKLLEEKEDKVRYEKDGDKINEAFNRKIYNLLCVCVIFSLGRIVMQHTHSKNF